MFHENDLPAVYFAIKNFDVPVVTLTVMMGAEPDEKTAAEGVQEEVA